MRAPLAAMADGEASAAAVAVLVAVAVILEVGTEKMGEGLRVTWSVITSSAHVSRDLKWYLNEMRAISMRRLSRVRSICGDVTSSSSWGLQNKNLNQDFSMYRSKVDSDEGYIKDVQCVQNPQEVLELCDSVSLENDRVGVCSFRLMFALWELEHAAEQRAIFSK